MTLASGGVPQLPPRPALPARAQAPERELPREIVLREEEEEEANPELVLLEAYQDEPPVAIIDLTGEEADAAAKEDVPQTNEVFIPVTPRKRRSHDLHDEDAPVDTAAVRDSSPVKRARRETSPLAYQAKTLAPEDKASGRARKRTPDEREDEDDERTLPTQKHRKRSSEEFRVEETTTSEEEVDVLSGRKRARVQNKLEVVEGGMDRDLAKAPRTVGSATPATSGATLVEDDATLEAISTTVTNSAELTT